MHNLNKQEYIIHRDLKFENIFVHEDGKEVILKVGDFGFAKIIRKGSNTYT
jgi:serine/threonine protein kinase